MSHIGQLVDADWPATWEVIEPVFRTGDAYPYLRDTTIDDAFDIWVPGPAKTLVAANESGAIIGTYYIKPYQPGQGSHVCNCGYIAARAARGLALASEMCEQPQFVAATDVYWAMQLNLVVSTNVGAVRLWRKRGFEMVGTLPMAFDHPDEGYVDAYVMYKLLGV